MFLTHCLPKLAPNPLNFSDMKKESMIVVANLLFTLSMYCTAISMLQLPDVIQSLGSPTFLNCEGILQYYNILIGNGKILQANT